MIKELTAKQEAALPRYVDKWLKIGLSTDPCNFEESKKAAILAYKAAGLKPPKKFYLFDCPISATIRTQQLSLSDSVWVPVWDQVKSQAEDQVWDQVSSRVRSQICDQVEAQVRNQILVQVWAQINSQINSQINFQVQNQIYGSMDADWLSFYYFCHQELGIDACSKLKGLWDIAQHCGWWAPYKEAVIFQHRPEVISLVDGLLHKDGGGPAIHYRGGLIVIWALHGVQVPQWLAETSAEDIDPRKLLKIDNAQVRAEFVRKVGIERICYSLKAKVLDSKVIEIGGQQHAYELLGLPIDGELYHYLKMQNPSVPELWHVEGVPQECLTVYAALNFRNGLTEEDIDDKDGAEWYQQGDLILRPAKATKFKRFPKVLT